MRKLKAMLPFLIVIASNYYFLPPLLTRDMETGWIGLIIIVPIICFVSSITYGVNNSFNALYAICAAVLYIPHIWVTPITFHWFSVFGYGIVALFGNIIGMRLYKRNVRIKNLEKYGRYLIIAFIGSFIASFFASVIMMNQMTQITYNATAFGATIREDIVDFEANTARRNYYDFYGELIEHEESSINKSRKFEMKLICTISLFPLWQKYYNNPWVLDGDYYNIVRNYGDRENVVYGSNAYPLTYRLVMWVIDRAFE